MAPERTRNRAREFEDLFQAQPADFDPEADDALPSDDDSDHAGSDAEAVDGGAKGGSGAGARDHYVDVQKSKLRRRLAEVPLGPQYAGVKVGRKGLDVEDEEDGFEGEWDQDEESEDEDLTGDVDDEEDEADSEEDGEEDEKDDDEEESEEEERPGPPVVNERTKAQLRDVMREERSVASSLSKAAQADAEKGRAVRKQRATFDTLLGARIKLQKSLVGVNTLVGLDTIDFDADASQAIQAAEEASFKLWSTLNQFREDLVAAQTGQKRKRVSLSESTSTEKLWKHMQDQEETCVAQRNAVLRKWSAKTGQATATSKSSGLRAGQPTATIIDALQLQLGDTDRLLKRASTPRSCAPLQLSKQISEDPKIYDDADFYGQLLKELLERKSSTADAAPAAIDLDFKAVKTKRNVDTKASKGRKLRYTVHEKLQNFMAPEERGNWEKRQADELFGSLFGRRMALAEDDADGMNGDDGLGNGDVGSEVDGDADFVMFRA